MGCHVLFSRLTKLHLSFQIRLQECSYNLAYNALSICRFLFGKIFLYFLPLIDLDVLSKSCHGCFLLKWQGKDAADLRKPACRIYGKRIDHLEFFRKKGNKLLGEPFFFCLPIESFRTPMGIMRGPISNILFLFGRLTRNMQISDMFFPSIHDTQIHIFGLESYRRKVAY